MTESTDHLFRILKKKKTTSDLLFEIFELNLSQHGFNSANYEVFKTAIEDISLT